MSVNVNYYWREDEFFTGDKIETIAQYIFDIENYINGDHGRPKVDCSAKSLINKQILEIQKARPSIIFVYGHDITKFLENMHQIDHCFKLITHNSDIGIQPEYTHYADDDKLLSWFGQNNNTNHPKITSLPIGIARKKYPHGDTAVLSTVSRNHKKTNLVYKNFDISTSPLQRQEIDIITRNNNIIMAPKVDICTYWNNISQSVFCISPPGNGIDCHRIWESLYLKTIPVVQYHPTLQQFKDLPILFVENWEEVDYNFLQNNINIVRRLAKKHDQLSFEYWKHKIIK